MDSIIIKQCLSESEIHDALSLAWEVFLKFEAPIYSNEGTEEFRKCLHDDKYLDGIEFYGAFIQEKIVGMIGIRRDKKHICFFFIKDEYHRRGIGTSLFRYLENIYFNEEREEITVNSSPYGVPFYTSLGFVPVDKEQTVNGIRFTHMVSSHFS